MSSNKKYWKSLEELDNNTLVESLGNNEFVEPIPTDEFLSDETNLSESSTTRRDFLKYVGFSTAAATLAACEGPVIKSIPYVNQPDTIIPGIADYYATTMFDGFDFANVLVRTREGRPIRIENNNIEGAQWSANARVNASVLSLYDNKRLKNPKIDGKNVSWNDINQLVVKNLKEAKASNKKAVLLTSSLASPSSYKLIKELQDTYDNLEHIEYDAVSSDAALDAYEQVFGKRGLAHYDLSKASYILSFDADFLGDWQGGGYDSGYTKGRVPQKGKMSKHVQVESNMTLSGAAADKRVPMKVALQKLALAKVYSIVTGNNVSVPKFEGDQQIENYAKQLQQEGSKAVLLSGIQDVNAQLLVLAINNALNSESFLPSETLLVKQGSYAKVNALVKDLKAGSVHTLIMSGVNPVYSLANGNEFAEALKKVKLSLDLTTKEDETATYCNAVAPTPHFLESWGDVQISASQFGLMQPTIRPLFDTKQLQECLMAWNESEETYHDYLKNYWSTNVLSGASWNQVLHDGVFVKEASSVSGSFDVADATNKLAQAKAVNDFEINFYTKIGMGDGQNANNPWLQEFPDPITRVSWDNYVTISKADAETLGVKNTFVANGAMNGDYINLTVGNVTLEKVPVVVQPGQAKGTLGLAFGYGKKASIQEEMQVGVNAYELYLNGENHLSAKAEKVKGTHEFACVQLQKTLMGRGDIIKETTLEIFNTKDAAEWNIVPMVSLDHQEVPANSVDLWESFDRSVGHHFNLSIDLNACTGCGACVIACHAENNVPVVGKREVRRSRDMHWLRIDRYYSSEDTFAQDNEKKDGFSGLFGSNGSLSGFGQMEEPADNPQVAFQPVMCQHCNHAPCETVCPVAATSHSRQGQNHMAYNRCVGTRYCANNCPYKVRRFNWFLYNNNDEFNYHMNDDLGKMVLNPDVNVRSRGVMEKCSFCIQMTQATILQAKKEGRPIEDGEFQTACSQACSNGAMKFGDVNDKESEVAQLSQNDRAYHLLEHVGTKPNVFYHVKVRNV